MVTLLHFAHLDHLIPSDSLRHFQNLDRILLIRVISDLPGGFALRAHTNTSSIERHGTRYAHLTTVAAIAANKLLHLSSP
jgi:hypothetical protein